MDEITPHVSLWSLGTWFGSVSTSVTSGALVSVHDTVIGPKHTGIIWPHGWPKVIFQSWNIIMILLTAIEKCCGYSKPLRLFHSYVWFICDNRSKLKKSGILSGGPLSTKKPWLHLVEHCGLTSWARGLSLVAAESAWNGLHAHITKTIFLIY